MTSHVRLAAAVWLLAVGALGAPARTAQAQILVPGGAFEPGGVAAPRRTAQGAPSAQVFNLRLDDAIERALERNLDIAVQRINPLVQDMAVATANAAFLPTVSSNFGLNQSTFPNRTLFDGGGLEGDRVRAFTVWHHPTRPPVNRRGTSSASSRSRCGVSSA